MNTGNIADWNGNMMDIGPIYPFVGWEVWMVIIAVVFWLGWHYLQIQMENRLHDAEAQKLRQGDNLQKAIAAEHSPERM
jgi:predicted negative regulator of RcsB-dependent stress response